MSLLSTYRRVRRALRAWDDLPLAVMRIHDSDGGLLAAVSFPVRLSHGFERDRPVIVPRDGPCVSWTAGRPCRVGMAQTTLSRNPTIFDPPRFLLAGETMSIGVRIAPI